MENWVYAFGTEDWRASFPGTVWQNESEPGTYAEAELALMRAVAADDPMSDYSLRKPRIIKRSDRHPAWQPVNDHAAEVLAEVLGGMAREITKTNPRVSSAQALAFVLATYSNKLVPAALTEEFDA